MSTTDGPPDLDEIEDNDEDMVIDEDDIEYQPDTKRKRISTTVKYTEPNDQCQQLYDIIRTHKKEDGNLLCEAFLRAPKKRTDPSYHEVISNPIDLVRIQQKIKNDLYEDIEGLSADIDLMVTNAKAFYKPKSQEYKDASDLWDLFIDSKLRLYDQDRSDEGKIILKMGKLAKRAAAVESRKPHNVDLDAGEMSESSSTTTDRDRGDDNASIDGTLSSNLEELFTAVMLATDTDGRPLHTVFQLLPSKKRYPTYYETIESPIDLKMIATKIQAGDYSALTELEKDLMLMCRNACTFNESWSQIYKDAKAIKRVVAQKKQEIEQGRATACPAPSTGKTSERIRNRKLRGGQSHSAITAALQYEDEEDEEEEMEEDAEEEQEEDEELDEEEVDDEESEEPHGGEDTDPMWVLYEAIASLPVSGPFLKLPSKRYYADYYNTIKNPISLSKIRAKIKGKEYGNITEIQTDMNIMFENAKRYNRPDSTLYKSAVKLQKIMLTKAEELLLDDDDGLSRDELPSKIVSSVTVDMEADAGTGRKSFAKSDKSPDKGLSPMDLLRRRYMILYRTLMDYKEDGRVPISVFMEKPSKKLYADYYKVIAEPIDMITIENNIKTDKYGTTDELVKDFKLMFDNCRVYNEEGSLIYEDANKLEKLLYDKIKQLGPEVGFRTKPKKTKKSPEITDKQRQLLDTLRDHRDSKGRQLSLIFQKLPSKQEYPDYYEVIKYPIDLDRIYQKLRMNCYDTLDDLSEDLMLMFENAYKFNEPDSLVYKDALILQRLAIKTKLSLSEDEGSVPDVKSAVREILLSIFTSVYNHQDEEGRCYTDTMAELPEFDDIDGQKVRGLTLDLIKSRLDRGFYKRLDSFQKDVFLAFERSRRLSRSDSQLFEDSVELHSYFIKIRDEICGNGSILKSPACKYTRQDLDKSVEAVRVEKKLQEVPHEDDHTALEIKKEDVAAGHSSQSENYNDNTYTMGDFVYVFPTTPSGSGEGSGDSFTSGGKANITKPNILCIEKLWTEPDGTKMFEGLVFLRPDQTYHLPTRKFLQREVFRSDLRTSHKLSEIHGKCWVMTVRHSEYFQYAPEGYAEEDTYVCEYRYSSRGKFFGKLKVWAFGSDRVNLVLRPKPLEPIRVASVFKDKPQSQNEDLILLDEDLDKIPREELKNIEMMMPAGGKEGFVFYEQYNLPCGPVRAGDYVYVRVENTKKLVARVDTMWSDNNVTNFHGPWFTTLGEISPSSVGPGRTFYKQEIFQSSIEDTNPLLSICGKCCVLDVTDYVKYRPTEVPEEDVFVCESLYEEAKRQIKKLDGLKKIFRKDPAVHQDEIYYFRKPITLTKVDMDGTPVPEMPKLKANKIEPMPTISGFKLDPDTMEDSLDAPPSLGEASTSSLINTGPSTPASSVTSKPPVSSSKKNKTPGKKVVTGYILYSSEVRKSVAEQNPTSSFGEISRIVGSDWKRLTPTQKQVYEEKAARMNETSQEEAKANAAAAAAAAILDTSSSPAVLGTPNKGAKDKNKEDAELTAALLALKKDPDWIFECCWEQCKWQFEDAYDLVEHCIQESSGHVAKYFAETKPGTTEGEFQCHWKNCARVKKGVNPFPNLLRLLKHVKDIHILKGNGRIIHPEMRSKSIKLSRTTLAAKAAEAAAAAANPIKKKFPPATPSGNSGNKGQLRKTLQFNQNASINGSSPVLDNSVKQAPPPPQPQVIVQQAPPPPPEPMFVAIPPRPQKLLHSEAYIRYIESLHNEQKNCTNWETTLSATVENTPAPEPEKLPTQWLAKGPGNHPSMLDALWSLRNFMMADSLNLAPK